MYTLTMFIAEKIAYAEDYEKIPHELYGLMGFLDLTMIVALVNFIT